MKWLLSKENIKKKKTFELEGVSKPLTCTVSQLHASSLHFMDVSVSDDCDQAKCWVWQKA